jgi:tuftelin-interacting protein 11
MDGTTTAPLAAWEKHTKGIGSKLLQKFGFKGRLGAKEDGISTAIEVQVRPTNVGLGFGTSEPTKEKNKEIKEKKKQPQLFGLEELEQDWQTLNNSGKVSSEVQEKKRRRFTTESFLKDYEEFMGKTSGAMVGPIIDMRQQDVKIINDLKDLSNESSTEVETAVSHMTAKPKYAQELLYHLAKQLELDSKRVQQEDQARKRFEEQMEEIRQRKLEEENRLKRLEKTKKTVLEIRNFLDGNHSISIDEQKDELQVVLKKLKYLYQECPQEFFTFGMTKIFPSIAEKLLMPSSDNILSNPLSIRVIFGQWQELTAYFTEQGVRSVAGEATSAFQFVAERDCLPIVRRFISSQWDPIKQCDHGVTVIELVKDIMSMQAVQEVIDVILIPRLTAALQAWNNDIKYPLHTWILPWLPILTSKLSPLYPDIRRKLLNSLRLWHAHETSAIAVISPWLPIFDMGCMENFLSKVIVPKLVDYVRRDFIVNPANQSLEVMEILLKWEPVLPRHQFACLFAGEILPKWLKVLIAWLNVPNCNFTEICGWYEGWQSIFPRSILDDEEYVLPVLKFALEVMKEVASRRMSYDKRNDQPLSIDLSLAYKSALQCIDRTDYYVLMKKHLVDAKFKEKIENTQKFQADRGLSSFTTSLRDVMAMMAEKHELDFKPKLGRSIEGKQVWEFGKTLCYIENNVIYSFRSANNSWLPISLDELVATAKQPM